MREEHFVFYKKIKQPIEVLTDQKQKVVFAFKKALKRREGGKPDDN